ncbi:MAG: hypothetical protein EOO50_12100 [Flavobacterium sp.]|uniref:DUF7674 family protein n=1 Tax=Flavobacterium sp. TaxID=239 RepID=UPI0011FEDE42|nr:hypothetical protein [Flavobacterium sp.]RZJ65856.1 MAG: hypothetical protein EOO50_12100 [Flavobacterium sp.]
MRNQITDIHRQAERFADVTKRSIMTGNVTRAKKLLAYAEKLLVDGNQETQNAISNVYVFSVSLFLEVRKCSISNLFPPALKADYIRQVNASGI